MNKETQVLDEALAYLNGEDTVAVNEITLIGLIGALLVAPYIAMAAVALIFLPSSLADDAKRNKLFKNNRKFFDAFNNFADKYATTLKKVMPKYGKYINSRRINNGKDITTWNYKEKYFIVPALTFDMAALKNDTKDINWEAVHEIYHYYGEEFDIEEDTMDAIDSDSVDISEIKANWSKVNRLKDEARKEYSAAVKQVKSYFDTNGCPSVISFSLLGEDTKEDDEEKNRYKDFDDLFIYFAIDPSAKRFYIGDIKINFGKGLSKVKMPEDMRKEIEAKAEK